MWVQVYRLGGSGSWIVSRSTGNGTRQDWRSKEFTSQTQSGGRVTHCPVLKFLFGFSKKTLPVVPQHPEVHPRAGYLLRYADLTPRNPGVESFFAPPAEVPEDLRCGHGIPFPSTDLCIRRECLEELPAGDVRGEGDPLSARDEYVHRFRPGFVCCTCLRIISVVP